MSCCVWIIDKQVSFLFHGNNYSLNQFQAKHYRMYCQWRNWRFSNSFWKWCTLFLPEWTLIEMSAHVHQSGDNRTQLQWATTPGNVEGSWWVCCLNAHITQCHNIYHRACLVTCYLQWNVLAYLVCLWAPQCECLCVFAHPPLVWDQGVS